MGRQFIFGYGMGIGLDFAGYVADNIASWNVVCFSRWFIVFDWCDFLSVAQNEIFACIVALVCYRWIGMFLFRCAIR